MFIAIIREFWLRLGKNPCTCYSWPNRWFWLLIHRVCSSVLKQEWRHLVIVWFVSSDPIIAHYKLHPVGASMTKDSVLWPRRAGARYANSDHIWKY
jgi:hypothetical protein